jgi:hypothetical protein
MPESVKFRRLPAFRVPTTLAYKATFLVNEAVMVVAFGAGAGNRLSAVGDELLQSPFHAILPGIY